MARRARLTRLSLLFLVSMAFAIDTDAAQVTATWTETSSNVDGFSIERASGTAGTYGAIATVAGGTTSFTDPNVTAGNTYCYRVRAFNGAGYSDYSNIACAPVANSYALVVVRASTGTGTVSSAPAGISCGSSCSAIYPTGSSVTLTATANSGSNFDGWTGGGCGGATPCNLVVTAPTTVTASFTNQTAVLTVTKIGAGTVTASPGNISCGSVCSAAYTIGTPVTLSATPRKHYLFTGWSGGGCSSTGPCTVTLADATTVTATFQKR
jgi:hypothetical protein